MSGESSAELSEELNLEDWFEREGISYRMARGRSGMQIQAKVCPVCDDRRDRVYLNAETGVGNCFKCDTRFNKLTFIFAHLNGREPEKDVDAAAWRETFTHVKAALAEQGWRPRRTTPVAVEVPTVKMPNSFALPTPDGSNLTYLESRGIDAVLSRYFGLRFCVDGWWNFTKEDGSTGGQQFGDRVIIPVHDLDGAFVTFQGRDITGTKDDKYLFPKMLPGTGRYLLNGQNAIGARQVCMGEGFFDVAAIKIALDGEVELRGVVPIGSFGKSLSYGSMDGDDQLSRLLKLKASGLEIVTIMWDGGAKELLAALDAADKLHRAGLKVRIARLPAGRDPNEVPPDVVRKAFWSAESFSASLMMRWRLRNPYAALARA